MGFSMKEIGRMTINLFFKFYNHYKTYYDFKLKKISYKELDKQIMQSEEWLPF